MEEEMTLKEILEEKDEKKRNKKLCEKYPWLVPTDWYGKLVVDTPIKAAEWDYSFTWLDAFPEGWFIAFGEEMLDEIDQEVKKGKLDSFGIDQIKDYHGELRVYCHGYNEEIGKIIDEYSALSRGICAYCGKPDVRKTTGWVVPVCFDCWFRICYPKETNTKGTYSTYVKQTEDSPLPDVLEWKSYNRKTKEWVTHTRDISQRANKIYEKYYSKSKLNKSRRQAKEQG